MYKKRVNLFSINGCCCQHFESYLDDDFFGTAAILKGVEGTHILNFVEH